MNLFRIYKYVPLIYECQKILSVWSEQKVYQYLTSKMWYFIINKFVIQFINNYKDIYFIPILQPWRESCRSVLSECWKYHCSLTKTNHYCTVCKLLFCKPRKLAIINRYIVWTNWGLYIVVKGNFINSNVTNLNQKNICIEYHELPMRNKQE